ncbi:hypothetical protein CK203_114356 [Vitis vinifera]|uniref:Uncharacterized protein n=1 Tax=Vitis vinifera TaxID=29760 RepID=A0A438EDN8_VITVI|nr:hypothetical protein CK203_114356 [Vitis vinifera]
MARTRGAKSSSPSNRKRSLRKEPSPGSVPEPAPQPSPSRPQPSPVKPAPPKPPARRYLTRSGGQPLKKKPRVESSEPIDLTEHPLRNPQILHRFKLQCRHRFPRQFPHLKQLQFHRPEAPLEEVIRRPLLPQPPIEGNLDCRTRAFHSELCFDLATFRVRPELAQSFQLLRRYHMEHLLAPRDFFYPRVVTDFYQTMTTKEHWTQRRGVLLEALYKMSEGFFFGPHHLIMAALLYFEEKVHKKKLQEQIAFHSSSQGCYAKFWSISDTPLSLSRKEREYAELAAIKACQEQMLASQAQQAAILRQLQVHFDLPQAVEPSIPTPPEPHSQPSESQAPEPEAPADPPTEEADPSA